MNASLGESLTALRAAKPNSALFHKAKFGTALSPAMTKKAPDWVPSLYGGEREIRTLVGVLAQTRFPVVRLRPAQPSLHSRLMYYSIALKKNQEVFEIFLKYFFDCLKSS